MRKLIFFIALLFLEGSYAQNIVPPLDIPLLLSGNFGELRHNHFHAGLDMKTEGRSGLPVKAVEAGFIARISVSPYGYGRAVYIEHPDGMTSVYGHLDCFAPRIESAVLDSQYRKESFSVDLHFSSAQFPVKRGETVAYSGNTGSSGGPHLHFEFRETATNNCIDPLPFFKNRIKDNRAPEIKGIMLFPQQGKGVVNGRDAKQELPPVPTPVKAWGEIGVGIKAFDRMTGTSNIYGVNEILLTVDGKEVYHSFMDTFSLDDTRYLNSLIDWTEWIENSSFFMKSFTEPGNLLGINRSPDNGIISITEEKTYHLEYILKDIYGNSTCRTFEITGEKTPLLPLPADKILFRFDRDNEYIGKGIRLKIPCKNLYTDLYWEADTINDYSPFAPLYRLGERIPLHSYCPVVLDITNDIYPDKKKYGVVRIYKDKKTWLGGEYQTGQISVHTRELGSFAIEIDTVPPVITPVQPVKWKTKRRISFRITDDLSGIESYRGTLDGRFVLFEYDAKTNSLFAVYEAKKMKRGSRLELTVTDAAGNRTTLSREL